MHDRTDWNQACIDVGGPDAEPFLQNQLTSDVGGVGASVALGAWCTAKGRVIVVFRLRRTGDGFTLALPANLVDPVLKRLTMYRLRSRVTLDARQATADDLGIDAALDRNAWMTANIEAGRAVIAANESELYTPAMLNLDLIGAVSFDKGCYPGQEVVARTHYRGASKRRMYRYGFDGDLESGERLTLDGRDVGTVVNAVAGQCLAVVPVDSRSAAGLSAAGLKLERLPLPGID
jgi:folate-binding protein YgfZ